MSGKYSASIPAIAIVGRPNVGKSTLFNRLAGEKIAIVEDVPGVTRDRLYAKMEWNGMRYDLIDTGGWVPEAEGEFYTELKTQLEIAVSEADAVIFLLDGKEGLIPADRLILDELRKIRKPVFFVVNKVDTSTREKFGYEFYELGAEKIYMVSAEHGRGVADLLDEITEQVPGYQAAALEEESPVPRIAVIGRPNVGKSSLINYLLGESRLLVTSEPGTTRDTVDNEVEHEGKKYVFVDTAGLRRKARIDQKLERISTIRALKAMERSNMILLMVDATEGATDQDAKLAGLILRRGRACIILVNKWDLLKDEKEQEKTLKELRQTLLHIAFAPVLTISAKTGLGIDKLFPAIDEVFKQYNRKIATGELNRKLEQILTRTQLPNRQGRPLKVFYATQTRVRPPTFVLFVNYPEIIKQPFSRFLQNSISSEFQFSGTPIGIEFRARSKRREKS